jgi:3-oxoacyl-[acyl-carrier protein] reductase
MGSLKNKRALVTAGNQGIGRAITVALLNAGCDVFVHYFKSKDGQGEVRDLAGSLGRKVEFASADLTVEAEAISCVRQAVEFLGGLDVLINNAGSLVARKYLSEIDAGFWTTVQDLNMTSLMVVTREAAAHLIKNENSSIVNLASLAGRKGGHPGSLAYSTFKGAILTWTRALAGELGPEGVRVNAVAPGLILGTSFHDTHTTKESAEETIKGIPIGRAGNPDDVARAVVFLASEYDGFITGETLDINGGVYCA